MSKLTTILTATLLVMILVAGFFTACGPDKEDAARQCRELMDSSEKAFRRTDILTSMKCLDEARVIAKHNNLHIEYYNVLNRLARDFVTIGDLEEGESLISESLDYAKEHLPENYQLLGRNNMGIILTDNGEYEKAKTLYEETHLMARRIDDSATMAHASSNLSYIAKLEGKPDLSALYVERALHELPFSDKTSRQSMLMGRIYYLIDNGNLQSARAVADSIYGCISPHKDKVIYDDLMFQYSRIAILEGDYDGALKYLSNINESKSGMSEKIKRYKALVDIYTRSGHLDRALTYQDSILATSDSLHRLQTTQLRAYSQSRFNYSQFSSELERKSTTLHWLIGLTIIVVAFALFAIRMMNVKRKKEMLIIQQQANMDQLKIKAVEGEKKAFRDKLNSVNNELAVQAHNIITRNSLIHEIISYLKSLPDKSHHMEYITKLRTQLISLEETEKVFEQLAQINDDFLTRLHEAHPELTASDIKYIIMVYRQFSIKEIAAILNISVEASKKRKQRIALKLGLESATDLYAKLQEFTIEKEDED
ncbi:MAG: hypothetical protein ACI31C_05825 [Muribaculaceae bacterium]